MCELRKNSAGLSDLIISKFHSNIHFCCLIVGFDFQGKVMKKPFCDNNSLCNEVHCRVLILKSLIKREILFSSIYSLLSRNNYSVIETYLITRNYWRGGAQLCDSHLRLSRFFLAVNRIRRKEICFMLTWSGEGLGNYILRENWFLWTLFSGIWRIRVIETNSSRKLNYSEIIANWIIWNWIRVRNTTLHAYVTSIYALSH